MKNYTHNRVRMVLGAIVLCAALLLPVFMGGMGATAAWAAAAPEPVSVTVPYRHIYTTTDIKVDDLFHYLVSGSEGAPLPAEANADGGFSVRGVAGSGAMAGGKRLFEVDGVLTFTFDRSGTYTYTVKADLSIDGRKPNVSRYTFEPRVYTVTFYVSEEEGVLTVSMTTIKEGDVKVTEIELDPDYEYTEPDYPPIIIPPGPGPHPDPKPPVDPVPDDPTPPSPGPNHDLVIVDPPEPGPTKPEPKDEEPLVEEPEPTEPEPTEPEPTEETPAPAEPEWEAPKTGVEGSVLQYGGMMAAAGVVIFVTVLGGVREKKAGKEGKNNE